MEMLLEFKNGTTKTGLKVTADRDVLMFADALCQHALSYRSPKGRDNPTMIFYLLEMLIGTITERHYGFHPLVREELLNLESVLDQMNGQTRYEISIAIEEEKEEREAAWSSKMSGITSVKSKETT